MERADEILEYWFGAPQSEGWGRLRMEWFAGSDRLTLGAQPFLPDYELAAAGELSHWEESPTGALALILLLDQISNVLYRGAAGAFSADALARRVARDALARRYDQEFPEIHRWFFYLPLEHSEDLSDQALSVELFSALEPTEDNRMAVDFALRHQRVIERFGRFPNRNSALGRESTPAELEFLAGPGAPY